MANGYERSGCLDGYEDWLQGEGPAYNNSPILTGAESVHATFFPSSGAAPIRYERTASSAWAPAPVASKKLDWSELPADLLIEIFKNLGTFDLLVGAGLVCPKWRQTSKSRPEIWKSVNLLDPPDYIASKFDLLFLADIAVGHSDGNLESFKAEFSCDDALLTRIAERNNTLKHLCLVSCDEISEAVFVEAIKRFPLLEELEITLSINPSGEAVEQVGLACPSLKQLRLNNQITLEEISDDQAIAISKSMTGLRHLQLLGNKMSEEGLRAIVQKCPHLETLDIRACFNLTNADLGAICANIQSVRFPHESTADLKFWFHNPVLFGYN